MGHLSHKGSSFCLNKVTFYKQWQYVDWKTKRKNIELGDLGLHYNSCKFHPSIWLFLNRTLLRSATYFLHVKLKMLTFTVNLPAMWSRNWDFCLFLFEQKTLLFKDIVNFVQLIVFSVVEKILFLFDCLMRLGLNSQVRFSLYNYFDWPNVLLDSTNLRRIEILIKYKSNKTYI